MRMTVRSSSGVLIIAIALDGNTFSCKYDCAFCPNECLKNGAKKNISRSYLSTEGTFLRGEISNFDPYLQIIRRLLELESMGHYPDKLEIILLGGTWDCHPKEYRQQFIHSIYYACNIYPFFSKYNSCQNFYYKITQKWLDSNPFKNKLPLSDDFQTIIRQKLSLEDEKFLNESAKFARISGIILETRPDQISYFSLIEKRKFGCTRIQIGIQHTNNQILKLNQRGHTIETSIRAICQIKDNAFKIDGHIMPDLPYSDLETDYKMIKQIFFSNDLQLDYVKIYPCLDLPFTLSRKWKEMGLYLPYAETHYKEFIEFLAYTLSIIPPWTRINRVHRDFPMATEKNNCLGYESETIPTNLHQYVHFHLEKTNRKCYDIRNREIRTQNVNIEDAQLYIRRYHEKNAIEYFISVEIPKNSNFDDSILLGFLRLRILKKRSPYCISSIKKIHIARIRELHVYGFISNTVNKKSIQHNGIGKFLLKIAEIISYSHSCTEIIVISGIGVRNYYRKFGYELRDNDDGEYLFKKITVSDKLFLYFKNSIYITPFIFIKKYSKFYLIQDSIGWTCYFLNIYHFFFFFIIILIFNWI